MNKNELKKDIVFILDTTKDLLLSDLESNHLDTTDLRSELVLTLETVLDMVQDVKNSSKVLF